jgi:hypothetical protein
MKLINPKIQTLAVFISLILMLFVSGCASTPGGSSDSSASGSGGSRTLKQVDLDVSPKMTHFHNAVASGAGVTEGEKDQVNAAYARYQSAYQQALQAAGNNPNTPAPANVTAAADELIGALGSIPWVRRITPALFCGRTSRAACPGPGRPPIL